MSQKSAQTHHSSMLHFIAGGLGGFTAAIVTQPLDVLKTRLQSSIQINQTYPFGLRTIYGLNNTYIIEGIPGLFRGLIPNLVGVVPSRAIHFASYTTTKDLIIRHFNQDPDNPYVHMLSAASAGVVVPTVMNPVFLVKTRIQLETLGERQAIGYVDCISKIYKTEGIRGFYRGLTASFLGIAETVIYFVMYERVKRMAIERKANQLGLTLQEYKKQGHAFTPLTFLALSGGCKLLASAITYPHEVVRTRMRERVNGQCRYPHLWGAFKTIAKEEGIHGLYKGMGAHLIRVVPNTAIMFAVYEGVVHFGGKLFIHNDEEEALQIKEDSTDH